MANSAIEKFNEIIHALDEVGALRRLVLVGSWCLPVYRECRQNEQIPVLRTMDLDFLIEKPKEKLPFIDVPATLGSLGFEPMFDATSSLVKYERLDLEIEFLSSRIRGDQRIVPVQHMNLNAQILSYMEIAQKYVQSVGYKGVSLKVPEMEAFILHKVLVYPLRNDERKKQKDRQTVGELSGIVIADESALERLRQIFSEFPSKWQKSILATARKDLPELWLALC